jgi:hypothetical protein
MNWIFKNKKELDRRFSLILKLEGLEEFRIWRDLATNELIKNLQAEIDTKADKMTEIELRAKLKTIQYLKYSFKNIFKEIRANKS